MICKIGINNIENYEYVIFDIKKKIIDDIKNQYNLLEKEIINIDKKECEYIKLWNTNIIQKDNNDYIFTTGKDLFKTIESLTIENLLCISKELERQIFIRFDSYIQNILAVNETRSIAFNTNYFINLSDKMIISEILLNYATNSNKEFLTIKIIGPNFNGQYNLMNFRDLNWKIQIQIHKALIFTIQDSKTLKFE
jgi:hypothetical protein